MRDILLINPNTSQATTRMMVDIAAAVLPEGWSVHGCTAAAGPAMIVSEGELLAAETHVLDSWRGAASTGQAWAGIVVSAFGDPGMAALRAACDVPVAGICEASLIEAAQGGRRFGIATVTPQLTDLIRQRVDTLGLGAQYTGIRLTPGDPRALAADPALLEHLLADAVQACIEQDGAQAVVIGGGPLARAAARLQARFGVPIVEPIPAALRHVLRMAVTRDAGRPVAGGVHRSHR